MNTEFSPIYRDLLNELLIMLHYDNEGLSHSSELAKSVVDKLCAQITAYNIIEITNINKL